MQLNWRTRATPVRRILNGGLVAVALLASGRVQAVGAQELTGPPALACPGLVAPGSPPDSDPAWTLQWDWQWSTFNQDASITRPTGVAVDRSCNVYVSDSRLDKVLKLSPQGATVAQWGSTGKGAGQLDSPDGVAVDGAANVYVADSGNDRLQKWSPDGQPQMVWANQFACRDLSGVKCTVRTDAFFGTLNVAADVAGNVFVVDAYNRVEKIGPDGGPVGTFGTEGSNLGQFRQPRGVGLDRQGNLYVADTLNNRVQKLAPDGTPLTQWKTTGSTELNQPRGVAVGGDGVLYIADTDNSRVVRIDPSGAYLGQWGRCSDDNDPCQQTGNGDGFSPFSFPDGLAVTGRGDVLVADTGNNRLQVYKAIPHWLRTEAMPVPTDVAPAAEPDSGGD